VTGTVYLGCGSAEDEADLWHLMLHRPVTRIIYWPFALPATMLASADDWLRANLDRLGAPYELTTWTRLEDQAPRGLEDGHLLFVGGGNTFRLLDQVRRAGLVDPVRRFVDEGGDYYGGSAGAVLACTDIAIAEGHDPNEPGLVDLTALGLLRNVAILPHFTEEQVPSGQEWATAKRRTLIGLPENAGLHVARNSYEVVGTGSVYVMDEIGTDSHSGGSTFGPFED